jgi:Sec-independent protein translocase protein TatA
MHVMAREAWTDERLDDLTKRVGEGFREVKAEQRALRGEMNALRQEVRAEMKEMRTELKGEMSELRAGQTQLNGRFDALLLILFAGFAGLVLAQLFG